MKNTESSKVGIIATSPTKHQMNQKEHAVQLHHKSKYLLWWQHQKSQRLPELSHKYMNNYWPAYLQELKKRENKWKEKLENIAHIPSGKDHLSLHTTEIYGTT